MKNVLALIQFLLLDDRLLFISYACLVYESRDFVSTYFDVFICLFPNQSEIIESEENLVDSHVFHDPNSREFLFVVMAAVVKNDK